MDQARIFRTRLALRLAVSTAAVFWAVILAFLAQFPEVTHQTFFSAAAFLAFFVLFTAHYDNLAVTVTADRLVFSYMWRRVPVRFEEIERVEVYPGVTGTVYDVRTPRGSLQFNSFFADHRELLSLLLERAHLDPSRRRRY
jgi:hypothetical protein